MVKEGKGAQKTICAEGVRGQPQGCVEKGQGQWEGHSDMLLLPPMLLCTATCL